MAQQLFRLSHDEDDGEELSSKTVDADFNRNGEREKAARLPRWTRQEILVLIQGKRVAESRVRRGRSAALSEQAEPKWATVSSYCKRHGVNRGPVQCRKRWSNLAGDFKKIKEWDSRVKDEADSFWLLRNDARRDRKLPGFFDREVFDILNSTDSSATHDHQQATTTEPQPEPVFDSGRSAASDDGLFSDFEHSAEHQHEINTIPDIVPAPPLVSPVPISGIPPLIPSPSSPTAIYAMISSTISSPSYCYLTPPSPLLLFVVLLLTTPVVLFVV